MLEQGSVCKINLDTEPRSKKTGTRRDRYITKQQKPGLQQQTGSTLYD